jgi:DNA topoisomerase I
MPFADDHIQATGRDAKDRKQYRYCGKARSTSADAACHPGKSPAASGPARIAAQKGTGAVVHLLKTTLIRVGNDEYAERNNSYGLTTLQKRHVAVDGNEVGFRFPARASLGVRDRRIAKIIKACQELPGQELLQFVDEAGNCQDVTSTDVNDHAGKLGNTSTICRKCYVPRKC